MYWNTTFQGDLNDWNALNNTNFSNSNDAFDWYKREEWNGIAAQHKAEYYAGLNVKSWAVAEGMFNVVTGVITLGESAALLHGGRALLAGIGAKGSKPFVQFSAKKIVSKGGQKTFSYQARFPKPNLNIRLDRGFRSPFKNTTSKYFGETYNGFNTHINIQKPGAFNYHLPLNPLKWKYYSIP